MLNRNHFKKSFCTAFLCLSLSLFLSACFEQNTEKAQPQFRRLIQPQKGYRSFKKVFQIVLENTNAEVALKQPFLAQLAKEGAYLNQFYAITHPSQANYIAMTSGDTNGYSGDEFKTVDVLNIVDLLEAKGKTWKLYAEDFPGDCYLGESHGRYVRRHTPLISYANIQNNSDRCAKIVNAAQLDKDITAGCLPDYAFYVPNLDHDGHDTGVKIADRWLSHDFGLRFKDPNFMKDQLVVITFDESANNGSENKIYTVLLGDAVTPGRVSNERYDFYNLLRTIEDQFNLGTLGKNDEKAEPITGIWSLAPVS